MPVVEFQPAGRRVEVPPGTSILAAAQSVSRDLGEWGIRSTCGGAGTCGQCRVRVEGDVSGADEGEVELLARLGNGTDLSRAARSLAGGVHRLACRTLVLGDVKVTLDKVAGGDRLQTAGTVEQVAPDPAVRVIPFEMAAPDVGERSGDADRLAEALEPALGERPTFDLAVLRALPDRLRALGFRGLATARGAEIIALGRGGSGAGEAAASPPTIGPLLGLAVDLGTTKIAGYLVNLETAEILETGARLNPQISFGEDVISRLGYAAASAENYTRIRGAVTDGLNELVADLCRRAGRAPGDVLDAVVVGNTAMHHLLAGLTVGQLARAPYVPAVASLLDLKARDLGLDLAPGAYVHLLPCVAGYVGGDHVAVLVATELMRAKEPTLAIDVGTNTEIALANRGKVLCCSCASGPAFEGGQISRGMRALAGAIDRVWLDGGSGRPAVRFSVIGGGEPAGFCGAALIDLLAVLYSTGAMDASGRLLKDGPGVEADPAGGVLQYALAGIPLTQKDIRQLQLAKAAIRSGIEGLLSASGTDPSAIRRVYLAGAFGTAIDPEAAMAIGMFPRLPLEVYRSVGNAAGMGAYLALASRAKREEAAETARHADYLELLKLPGYQDLFLKCINLPEPRGGA